MPEESLLATDVADELRAEPGIHAERISVSASDGVLVLSGNVDSYREKDLAGHAALRIVGVRAVADDITVEVPAHQQRSDQEIAEAAAWALRWNAAVPDDAVQLTVDDGWVTLYGSVAWQFDMHCDTKPETRSVRQASSSKVIFALTRYSMILSSFTTPSMFLT
jgi:osmotically-inducible protein OsmY